MTVGKTKLGRTALGASLRPGALMLSVGEAQMYGGVAKGSFSVARSDAVADVKAQFQFTDVDLQACAANCSACAAHPAAAISTSRWRHRAPIRSALRNRSTAPRTLTSHDGALTGFNIEQLLRRLERRPLSGAGDFRHGTHALRQAHRLALKFADGIATTEDVRLDGPTVQLTLTGAASIPTREFDLKGVASLVSAPNGNATFELPFVIQGPWDDPLILPDPESLLRRSPASAPLLDAVNDRKTRDAVKSAIERLTGGPLRPAAPDAPAAVEAAKPN